LETTTIKVKNNNKQLIKERLEQLKASISRISLLEEKNTDHKEKISNKHSEYNYINSN